MAFRSMLRRDGLQCRPRSVLSSPSVRPSTASFCCCTPLQAYSHRRRRRALFCDPYHGYESTTLKSSDAYASPCPCAQQQHGQATGISARRAMSSRYNAAQTSKEHLAGTTTAGSATSPAPVSGATPPQLQSGDSVSNDDSFALRVLGPRWSAYGRLARIDKPAGALLLAFPCWWGVALATPIQTLPDPWLLTVFGTSAFVMRYDNHKNACYLSGALAHLAFLLKFTYLL